MSKLTTKIALPIILTGVFAILAFIALGTEQFSPGFYAVMLFLVIFVFFFGLAIGQNLSSVIKKISDKAEELSRGNLYSRVYVETKDELSELANALNKIAEELTEARAREEEAEKSVGIKVQARTHDLEETINALEQKVRNRTIELDRLIGEYKKLQEAAKAKK